MSFSNAAMQQCSNAGTEGACNMLVCVSLAPSMSAATFSSEEAPISPI